MIITILVAMLLSTVSARTLKDVNDPPWAFDCANLWICVYDELVGNKTLTIEVSSHDHGKKIRDMEPNRGGVWCAVVAEDGFYGPDFNIEFYLDKVLVHKGHYQQNYCQWAAGDITTDDPSAVCSKGSYNDKAGRCTIRYWE